MKIQMPGRKSLTLVRSIRVKYESAVAASLILILMLSSCKKEDVAPVALSSSSTTDDMYTETGLTKQTPITRTIDANIGGYLEALPAHYLSHPNKRFPVIFFLHGQGEEGNGSQSSLPIVADNAVPKLIANGTFPSNFVVSGTSYQFIVLSPQFKGWPQPSDINDMINFAVKTYRIDTARMYLCGLSMGGGGVWDYGWNLGSRIAAMVPIAGASWPTTQKGQYIAQDKLAVWAFHNNNDPTVPSWYSTDYVQYINQYKPVVAAKLTIFNSSSHDAWTTATNPNYKENNMNIYQWMLSYKKKYTQLLF